MTIGINGMAHVILTMSRFEVAREFYRKLLEFAMKPVFDGDGFFYCVGARTAIGIEPCDPALGGERFVQQRVGLHHLCLRARSREDVDRCVDCPQRPFGCLGDYGYSQPLSKRSARCSNFVASCTSSPRPVLTQHRLASSRS